jgi:hypothetical protein
MTSVRKHGTISKAFCITIIFAGVVAWEFEYQIVVWHFAKQLRSSHPHIYLVPQPLPPVAPSNARATTLTHYGYEFEAPWADMEIARDIPLLVNFEAPGGQILVLWQPERSPVTTEIRIAARNQKLNYEKVLGSEGLQSDYSLLKAEMEVTPDQISPFMNKNDAVRRMVFLTMKAIVINEKMSAIYSFNSNGLHGFQFGDPATDELIQVQAYDSNDLLIKLWFAMKDHSSGKIPQSEINRVMETFHSTAKNEGQGAGARN